MAVLELAVLVQAALDVIGQVRGHVPGERATHVAYLVATVALLPAVAGYVHGDDGRWAAALLAIALVVLAILVIRLQTTWR